MRTWNPAEKQFFEPAAAEIFGVVGRKETRPFTCVAVESQCFNCAFKDFNVCRLIACEARERKDKRNVAFFSGDHVGR